MWFPFTCLFTLFSQYYNVLLWFWSQCLVHKGASNLKRILLFHQISVLTLEDCRGPRGFFALQGAAGILSAGGKN